MFIFIFIPALGLVILVLQCYLFISVTCQINISNLDFYKKKNEKNLFNF